jgi:hypothetical protein
MIREVIPSQNARFLTCEGHLSRNFLHYSLIENCLIKEDQGVAHDKSEKHTIEDAHAGVEEEEKDTAEHNNAAHQVRFTSFRPPLTTAQDWHIVIH